MKLNWIAGWVLGIMPMLFAAQRETVVELKGFRHQTFAEAGLTVRQAVDVTIDAQGAADPQNREILATAWILDATTRKTVWRLTDGEPKRHWDIAVDDQIHLAPGSYEVYFGVTPRPSLIYLKKNANDFFSRLFDGRSSSNWRRNAEDWGVTLRIDPDQARFVSQTDITQNAGQGIALIGLGDDAFRQTGFKVTKPTRIRIYAVGEGSSGEMYDYGSIQNADTGERIWEMSYGRTQWAGGASKNRRADEEILLTVGSYRLSFVTDDSHSSAGWNQLMPEDPHFWGVTLWPLEGGELLPEQTTQDDRLIVQINRVGNDESLCKGFTLTHPTRVRVRCLGEMARKKYFADYGWIVNARTRERVWDLASSDFTHAGGGKKNQMFDGVIRLDAGDYQVCYQTDDSHAYGSWNTAPPYDPNAWGITLWGVGDDFQQSWITPFQSGKDDSVLVQIIRVGDDARRRARFVLDKSTTVRIYALGEGSDGEMFDYGWIEDEDGDTVWRMRYEDTRHAGGADKNRLVNTVITLKPSEYRVYYKTDGSHSYEDWNDDPPDDAAYWGITIRKEK